MKTSGKDNNKNTEKTPRKVIALIDALSHNGRSLLTWLETNRLKHWRLIATGWMPGKPWLSLNRLDPDGILTDIPLKNLNLPKKILSKPIVGLSWQASRDQMYPCIVTDYAPVTQIIVDHFIELGLQQLIFFGAPQRSLSIGKENNFQAAANRRERNIVIYRHPLNVTNTKAETQQSQQLIHWLQHLPKPSGIFAWNALSARMLLDECMALGIRVPEDISLVAAENDPLFCKTTDIPISSVSQDIPQIAGLARDILEDLMEGKTNTAYTIQVPAKELTIRKSSSLSSAHWLIARTYDYIHKHITTPLRGEDIINALGVSRRSLERIFQENVGRTPHNEILRLRIEKAKSLLCTTDQSIEMIAQNCGFSCSKQLLIHFKKSFGMPPSAFRKLK